MIDLKKVMPENLWYVIGYIATDGHLSKDGRHIDITSKDRLHLFHIRKLLGITNKVSRKFNGLNSRNISSHMQFGDVHFYRYLQQIGFVQNKSLHLGSINIDHIYFKNFLRGVIDGDGSICTWIHPANLYRQWSLRIVSAAPDFIQWLKKETEHMFKVNKASSKTRN